ncbi:MAG TPA: cytochrome c [Vicinamibacterales bacterium]|nr:cytochrome c [Vicinamibacterales bacterium]
MRRRWIAAALLAASAPAALLFAHDPLTRRVTWNGDVARIVQARCVRCHTEDGRGPMSLATYEDARPWARAIREEVIARRMPKWHAARGYGEFRNDPSLSPFEIALVAAWADGGAPRGPEVDVTSAEPAPAGAALPGPPEGKVRRRRISCGARRLPPGRLLAFRPILEKGASVGLGLRAKEGDQLVLGWIRHFDPEFPETYWLRTPIDITAGTVLVTDAARPCAIELVFSAPR